MVLANWASDAAGLTFLVLGILGFVLALIFRAEIKELLGRITDFQWREARVRADPPPDPPPPEVSASSSDSEVAPNEEAPEPEEEPSSTSGPGDKEESEQALRTAMINAFFNRNRQEGEQKFQKLKSLVQDSSEAKRDEIRRATALFMGGLDDTALGLLDKWTSDPDVAWFALRMKGVCLGHAGQHQEAADVLKQAASDAESPLDSAEVMVLRSKSLTALGSHDIAQRELEQALQEESDMPAQRELWGALATVHENAGNKLLKATALHKVAELWGNKSDRWFSAGYAYGNAESDGLAPLSVHCYLTALRFNPESHWAINNLGAELAGLNMLVLAVDRYKQAADKGNTLALGNLAERYLRAGFSDDAKRVIDQANEIENPDDKIATVGLSIRDTRKEAENRLSELVDRADQHASFFLTYTRERLFPLEKEITGKWKLDNNKSVTVSLSDGQLEFLWKEGSGKSHRRVVGTLAGCTAYGSFEKESTWPYSDDSIHWESDGKAYVAFNQEGSDFTILRVSGASTAEYFRGTRLGPST